MGRDIWEESGVIVEIGRMVRAIKEEHLNQLKVAVDKFLATYSRAAQGNANDEDQSILGGTPDPQGAAETLDYFSKLKDIEKTTDLTAIHEILDSVIEAEADDLRILWDLIIEHCFPKVPYIYEIRCFDHGSCFGDDLPMGKVCIIFDSDDCFTVKMSVAGKALKHVVGSIEEQSWVVETC